MQKISNSENGFQAFTTNPRKGHIFLAEYGENPTIKCYSEDLKLLSELKGTINFFKIKSGVCQLEIKDMDYKPEQDLLILQCGLPEMSLVLVDWGNKEVLQTNSDLSLGSDFVKLKFNPLKQNQILILKKNSLQKLELERRDFLVKQDDYDKVSFFLDLTI